MSSCFLPPCFYTLKVSEHDLLGRCRCPLGMWPWGGAGGHKQAQVWEVAGSCNNTAIWLHSDLQEVNKSDLFGRGAWWLAGPRARGRGKPGTKLYSTGRKAGSRSSQGPRPFPRAQRKASGGLRPRLRTEGRAVASSLRPRNPELAETGALRQGGPAAPGARPRGQKESEQGGGGGEGTCTVVLTSPRCAHYPGCRGCNSPTGSALARKHRPTGSGSAPRRCPPRRQPPDQSPTSPPRTHSFPGQPLALRSRGPDWLESATSPRARRVTWTGFPPNSRPWACGVGGPQPLTAGGVWARLSDRHVLVRSAWLGLHRAS